ALPISLFLFVIALMVGCRSPELSPPQASGTIPAIDSLITGAIAQNHIPGAVIQIKQGDSLLHRAAYGYAKKFGDNREPLANPEKMTTEHLFDLASLTKVAATTFGVMLLVDEEKVRLDDPIHNYLPEFRK